MLLDVQQDRAVSYACIGTPFNLFSFTMLARSPRGYTMDSIRALVESMNKSTGHRLDLNGIRIADETAFTNCNL